MLDVYEVIARGVPRRAYNNQRRDSSSRRFVMPRFPFPAGRGYRLLWFLPRHDCIVVSV